MADEIRTRPPDGEYLSPAAEFALPPPEYPPRQYAAPELPPLPPEYGQTSGPAPERKRRRRSLRRLLATAVIAVLALNLSAKLPEQGDAAPFGAQPSQGTPADAEAGSQTAQETTAPEETPETTAPAEAPEPAETDGFLWISDAGHAEYKASLYPPEGSTHSYALRVQALTALFYDENQQLLGSADVTDDPVALEIERDDSGGYHALYSGPCDLDVYAGSASYIRFHAELRDETSGYLYAIDSNICRAPRPSYPLGDELIEITVYNDTLTFDYPSEIEDDGYVTVRSRTQINAADFTEFELPTPLFPAGYQFGGYVVLYNAPFDNGYQPEEELFVAYNGDPPVEAMIPEGAFAFAVNGYTLSKEQVELIPVSDDGVRYVNVHASWLIADVEAEFTVELDDGNGNVTLYPVSHPLASEGYFYTFTFPQPTPPAGMYFDGWYNEEGERVDLLVDFFSFTPAVHNADGSFAGYDWSTSKTVHLIAHWASYT